METKIKTAMVFYMEYPNLKVKVFNTTTKQFDFYKEFKARNYKNSSKAISAVHYFIADHINDYHFNGVAQGLFEFGQAVDSYNGYYGY